MNLKSFLKNLPELPSVTGMIPATLTLRNLWVLFPADALLKRYHKNLVGMHIHDARGLDDHFPPGSGEIDFKKIVTWIGDDTLKVIELKLGTPDSDVASGIYYLGKIMKL
jgi:hypothetical protein